MLGWIGSKAPLWSDLCLYLADHYDHAAQRESA